jgi:hypothetical protein
MCSEAARERAIPPDDGGPGPDRDGDEDGGGILPRPVAPDLAFESLICLKPDQRQALQRAVEDGLRKAEATLSENGVSLSPNPRFVSGCFEFERGGAWGAHLPDQESDRTRFLQSFGNFLTGGGAPFSEAGLVISRVLLDKAANAIRPVLNGILPRELALLQVEIVLEAPNRVITILRGQVQDTPFPFNLWPPTWTVTLVETLSLEQTENDCVPKQLLIHSDLSADFDISLLERIFVDLGVFPILGLFPLAAFPFFVPGLPEVPLNLAPGWATAALTGEKIPGIGTDLVLPLPSQILLEGAACEKQILDYTDVGISPPAWEGIRVLFNICKAVPREPKVSIVPFAPLYGNPIHVRLSRLTDARLPLRSSRYRLTDIEDLRGDPETELQIAWQATPRATVLPLGRPTAVEVYFNLSEDRDRFQVGQQLQKLVSATVTDLDGCQAEASFPVTIEIIADPEDDDGRPTPDDRRRSTDTG